MLPLFCVTTCHSLFCNALYLYNPKVLKLILNITRGAETETTTGAGEAETRETEAAGGATETEGGKTGGGGEEAEKERGGGEGAT